MGADPGMDIDHAEAEDVLLYSSSRHATRAPDRTLRHVSAPAYACNGHEAAPRVLAPGGSTLPYPSAALSESLPPTPPQTGKGNPVDEDDCPSVGEMELRDIVRLYDVGMRAEARAHQRDMLSAVAELGGNHRKYRREDGKGVQGGDRRSILASAHRCVGGALAWLWVRAWACIRSHDGGHG